MKRKGFTLVELLVVIGIIALLMSILMPTLTKVRQLANRIVCGANLSGIGKAMMIYANENDGDLPRAGGRRSQWDTDGKLQSWYKEDPAAAFGGTSGAPATITSCLYLLVKYAEVQSGQFICKGDNGVKKFLFTDFTGLPSTIEYTDPWDFGGHPTQGMPHEFCSYAYQIPLNGPAAQAGYPLTSASNSASPVCADRNPCFDEKNAWARRDKSDADLTDATCTEAGGYVDRERKENSACHNFEGQNVLFLDTHVSWEKYPNVGIENDNIYKYWPNATPTDCEIQLDTANTEYTVGTSCWGPESDRDAWLVNEDNNP
ncbi:MAG: type II secretion system protein [Planctomycetes bacterium]|nr:type II secretion system protein [Planctomycetota bacterium]